MTGDRVVLLPIIYVVDGQLTATLMCVVLLTEHMQYECNAVTVFEISVVAYTRGLIGVIN